MTSEHEFHARFISQHFRITLSDLKDLKKLLDLSPVALEHLSH